MEKVSGMRKQILGLNQRVCFVGKFLLGYSSIINKEYSEHLFCLLCDFYNSILQ